MGAPQPGRAHQLPHSGGRVAARRQQQFGVAGQPSLYHPVKYPAGFAVAQQRPRRRQLFAVGLYKGRVKQLFAAYRNVRHIERRRGGHRADVPQHPGQGGGKGQQHGQAAGVVALAHLGPAQHPPAVKVLPAHKGIAGKDVPHRDAPPGADPQNLVRAVPHAVQDHVPPLALQPGPEVGEGIFHALLPPFCGNPVDKPGFLLYTDAV